MKTCIKCNLEKDILNFSKYKRNKDGLSNTCKQCKSKYDNQIRSNMSFDKKKLYKIKQRDRILNIFNYINNIKISKGCVDCGYNISPAALQFDHLYNKEMEISSMIRQGFSILNIQKEMNKCEIRCANCHLIKTSNHFNWYK